MSTETAAIEQTITNEVVEQIIRSPSLNEGDYFGRKVRIGSRKIQLITIKSKFSLLPKEPNAQTLRDEVIKKVGSQWKSGTRDIIRGLTQEEELKYLPSILGIKPTSDDWDSKILEWWANFSIEVPGTEKGIEFEAGFQKSNKGETEPISLDGYMKYNFCKANSDVANEEEDNLITKTFQLIDKAKVQIEAEQLFTIRKTVDREFLIIVRSTDLNIRRKIDWILEIHGGPDGIGMNISGLTDVQKEMALEEFKDKNLSKFGEIINDSSLETKALIQRATSVGQLSLEGNTYFFGNKSLGNFKQTVAYYTDSNNQKDRLILVARLKELGY